MSAQLIIIRGLPGAGKSTLAGRLWDSITMSEDGDHNGCVMLSADDYMIDENNNYKFDPTRLSECHASCQLDTLKFLSDGYVVIVHNTFTQQWELQPYRDMAETLNIPLQEITVKGPWKNTHGCPEEKIAQMAARWEP